MAQKKQTKKAGKLAKKTLTVGKSAAKKVRGGSEVLMQKFKL